MIQLNWKQGGIATIAKYSSALEKERIALLQAAKSGYDDVRASINLPLDTRHLREAKKLATKYKDADLLIVVGIGGSNLGTMAVQEALTGKLHNLHTTPKVLYADTVDPVSMQHITRQLDMALTNGKDVVLNIISKSGGTTETVANAELLIACLKKHRKEYAQNIVCTTDEGSKLWKFAQQEGFNTLAIPKNVGGRYSVFSHVGLFPLAVLGINITKLLAGAESMRTTCLSKNNPAQIRAALLAHSRKNGRNIADMFYFKTDFESIGKWYRQLMGESIGKEHNLQGKRVWMGLTPTVSIGTTDLHSMAQLYFGGPKDKFHTLVTVNQQPKVRLPKQGKYDALVPNIQGRTLNEIMDAVVQGVQAVLTKQKRPHCTISLPDLNEHTIGALLQLHMMEMMYLAALLNVNPFDQPNVEAYKIETKRFLS